MPETEFLMNNSSVVSISAGGVDTLVRHLVSAFQRFGAVISIKSSSRIMELKDVKITRLLKVCDEVLAPHPERHKSSKSANYGVLYDTVPGEL